MALLLTSHGVLARAHHLAERSPAVRTGVLTATAGAAGLAMGKTRTGGKKVPIIIGAAGVGLSLLGFTAIGDGAAASGATLLGYRFGIRSKRKALLRAAAASNSMPGPVASAPGLRKVVVRKK